MTFLLNYLYIIFLIAGGIGSWIAYKKGNFELSRILLLAGVISSLFAIITTPYIPVDQGKRVLPVNSPMVDAPLEPIEVQNRLLVPRHTPEQSEVRAKEVFDWKAKVADNKGVPSKPAQNEPVNE